LDCVALTNQLRDDLQVTGTSTSTHTVNVEKPLTIEAEGMDLGRDQAGGHGGCANMEALCTLVPQTSCSIERRSRLQEPG